MELLISADSGSTLEELVTAAGFDRDTLSLVEVSGAALRSHGLIEYTAAFAAVGGLSVVLHKLELLVKYCIDHSKRIVIDVSVAGISLKAEWEGTATGSGSSRIESQ